MLVSCNSPGLCLHSPLCDFIALVTTQPGKYLLFMCLNTPECEFHEGRNLFCSLLNSQGLEMSGMH
jgi:hypothetical protein